MLVARSTEARPAAPAHKPSALAARRLREPEAEEPRANALQREAQTDPLTFQLLDRSLRAGAPAELRAGAVTRKPLAVLEGEGLDDSVCGCGHSAGR